MTAFYIIVMSSYFLLLTGLMVGWYKARKQQRPLAAQPELITVLVPFRNEANTLHHLIYSLTLQDYPITSFEVLLIDDHSEDNSKEVVRSLIYDKPNFKLLEQQENDKGKKAALTLGVNAAKGSIMVTADADCKVPMRWLSLINQEFQSNSINMVFGAVKLTGRSFFSKLQAMEFASLIGAGVATLQLGFFTMCNGANLAFRKSAFEAINGYQGNLDVASGDDEFLARKILDAFPGSVKFLNSQEAVVESKPQATIKDFIQQRLRWAGKWKYNRSLTSKGLAVFILVIQLTFLSLLIGAVMLEISLPIMLMLIGIKLILEGWLLYLIVKFLRLKWSYFSFFVLQLIYPIYVVSIGLLSLGRTYDWKGRRLSHKM